MASVVFEVEQAGCESCAARVRVALEPLGDVDEVVIDEQADTATVRVQGELDEAAVNAALQGASHGSGHTYRVRAGSWQAS